MGGFEVAQRVRLDPQHRSVLLIALAARYRRPTGSTLERWLRRVPGEALTVEMLTAVAQRLPGGHAEALGTG
jgi:hypothetical protein